MYVCSMCSMLNSLPYYNFFIFGIPSTIYHTWTQSVLLAPFSHSFLRIWKHQPTKCMPVLKAVAQKNEHKHIFSQYSDKNNNNTFRKSYFHFPILIPVVCFAFVCVFRLNSIHLKVFLVQVFSFRLYYFVSSIVVYLVFVMFGCLLSFAVCSCIVRSFSFAS